LITHASCHSSCSMVIRPWFVNYRILSVYDATSADLGDERAVQASGVDARTRALGPPGRSKPRTTRPRRRVCQGGATMAHGRRHGRRRRPLSPRAPATKGGARNGGPPCGAGRLPRPRGFPCSRPRFAKFRRALAPRPEVARVLVGRPSAPRGPRRAAGRRLWPARRSIWSRVPARSRCGSPRRPRRRAALAGVIDRVDFSSGREVRRAAGGRRRIPDRDSASVDNRGGASG